MDSNKLVNLNSVDSLLIHNYQPTSLSSSPSPPYSSKLAQTNNPYFSYQHSQQQNFQSYRRVRPEPINEKSIVDSMVGFFQDVVGGCENFNHSKKTMTSNGSNKPPQHHGIVQSGSSTLFSNVGNASALPCNEIKEQIEWLHFEYLNILDSTTPNASTSSSSKNKNSALNSSSTNNIILVLGYKTGFSVWTIDLNGVATEVLSIREPNIKLAKLIQFENTNKILIAICKLILTDINTPNSNTIGTGTSTTTTTITTSTNNLSSISTNLITSSAGMSPSSSSSSSPQQQISPSSNMSQLQQQQHQISIINLLNGECLHEILFNGDVLEMKSNSNLLCVSSWNRIDAFDLNTFDHRFSIGSCFSQISKSSGKQTNPFTLGNRWLAFADNKFHVMLSSQGGVSTDIEQSYTATVLNTAKSISKGLVKISETVVNSVVSKSKNTGSSSSSSNGGQSPRLNSGNNAKIRHDSKEDFQAGVCTIVDTKKFFNNSRNPHILHEENQNWIVAHFLAHHQESIYALEFNSSGRLLVTADCLGQYFNVFQINSNSYKCTRTVVKHIYSLYRGDTTSKVRNISFSNDSRWLAISTKRGTTHIFPLNSYGGPVNARTHSKSHVVNRTTKHQRTAGFVDTWSDDLASVSSSSSCSSSSSTASCFSKMPLLINNSLFNGCSSASETQQQFQMQQMLQQQYDSSSFSPVVINNNPKLRSLMEPFVIPAYGQLKQPNTNSAFQSSIISSNAAINSNGLLMSALNQNTNAEMALNNNNIANSGNNSSSMSGNTIGALSSLTGSNLAASALSSAALVTENMTNFGIKNFSLLASNTSNMIQYDNVCSIGIFGESRGYLSPEEPRDYTMNRMRPANSLFVISDVNGNLVEYVLDVLIDTSKTPNNKPTNDSPIMLKLTPKAQWPLQRFVSSDEHKYPIQSDNPLLNIYGSNSNKKQFSSNSNGTAVDLGSINSSNSSFSPNSFVSNSLSSFVTAPSSLVSIPSVNDEWIKMIDVTTHIGPHRRLFMGPQFVFKTFNSNLTTTKLNPSSSSVISDVETPIIDLSNDIELNTLDLTSANIMLRSNKQMIANNQHRKYSTMPMQINSSLSKQLNNKMHHQRFDSTPTYIEVGSGSFQEGMPILCGSVDSRGSQKSLNSNTGFESLGENLIESLADAMNELNSSGNGALVNHTYHHSYNGLPLTTPIQPQLASINNQNLLKQQKSSGAIEIGKNNTSSKDQSSLLLVNPNSSGNSNSQQAASSVSSNNSNNSVFTVGSYFLINPTISGASNLIDACAEPSANVSSASYTSTSSGSTSSSNSGNINEEDTLSFNSSAHNYSKNSNGKGSCSSNNDNINKSNVKIKNCQMDETGERIIYHNRNVTSLENIQFQDDSNLLQ